MRTGKSCALCGCPLEEGVKIFGIVDMILAILVFLFPAFILYLLIKYPGTLNWYKIITWLVVLIFVARVVFAILLVIMGVPKKNKAICWSWIFITGVYLVGNSIFSIIVMTSGKGDSDIGSTMLILGACIFLIPLYLVYGLWLVIEFVRTPVVAAVVPTVSGQLSYPRQQPPPAYSPSHFTDQSNI